MHIRSTIIVYLSLWLMPGFASIRTINAQHDSLERVVARHLQEYQFEYVELQKARGMMPLDESKYNLGLIQTWLGYLDAGSERDHPSLALVYYAYDTAGQRLHCFIIDREEVRVSGSTSVSVRELTDLQSQLAAVFKVRDLPENEADERGVTALAIRQKGVSADDVFNRWSEVLFPGAVYDTLVNYPFWLIHPVHNLGTLPWYALRAGGAELVDRHTLHILEGMNHFSLASRFFDFQFASHGVFRPLNPVFVGNPSYTGCNLNDLPGARVEAEYAAGAFHGAFYSGEVATAGLMLGETGALARSELIYLATHAVAYPDAPMQSPVYFASENGACRYLTAADIIAAPKMPEALVVLSACETGRGRNLAAGTIGLARSFLLSTSEPGLEDGETAYFGAQNVIMSLWNVEDRATLRFMTGFVQELKAEHPFFPAGALREAALRMRKTDPDPMHWAAFTGMGVPFPVHIHMKAVPAD